VVVAAAGCGGHTRSEPRLAARDAQQLIALAQSVARDAPADGCAARREIESVRAKSRALVAAGRVPTRLQAPLLAGVARLVAAAPPCTPPAPAPVAATTASRPAARPQAHPHGHERAKQKGKGKAKGHGPGHDHGDH
jgi:hypothetical protein